MWYSPEPVVDPPPHTYFFRQEYVPGKELVPALGSVPAAVREEYVRSRAFEPPPLSLVIPKWSDSLSRWLPFWHVAVQERLALRVEQLEQWRLDHVPAPQVPAPLD